MNEAALDASLKAADLVICQTRCVSHDAYWRVQDQCKRTGKQCVLVAQPHVMPIVRRLSEISTLPANTKELADTEQSLHAAEK